MSMEPRIWYFRVHDELLERAIAQVRALPEADQDIFAASLLSALNSETVLPLDDATRAAIKEGVAQAENGEFASDEEIASLWRRHGL
jgi:predicted transcriptional regulator